MRQILLRLRHLHTRKLLIALCIYGLMALLITYPVPLQVDSVILGDESGDAYYHTWSMWRAKQVVLNRGRHLDDVELINHPVGVEVPAMLATVGFHAISLPFSLLLSPATTYNALVLLTFVLNGVAMYALCAEVVGNHGAALVGGFIFAFSPHRVGQAIAGHLPQLMTFWTPLYVLFLHRTIRLPCWSHTLASALALAFACLTHLTHIAYLVLPVTITIIINNLLDLKTDFFNSRRWAFTMLTFLLAASVTAPFLLPALSPALESGYHPRSLDPIEHSANLLAFLTPSPYHPLLKALGTVPRFSKSVFPDLESLHEGLLYIGLLSPILAVWGLIQRYREARLWGALALMAAILSLGPVLRVGGATIPEVPMLNTGQMPSCFGRAAMFGIALLASHGIAALHSHIISRKRLLSSLVVFSLFVVSLEFLVIWPLPVSTADIPPAIRWISAQPGSGAVLHLDLNQDQINHRALYYQTATRRPIVGGQTESVTFTDNPWAQSLFGLVQPQDGSTDIVPRPIQGEQVDWLRHFGVDYVVLHKSAPGYVVSDREFIERLLGAPQREDPDVAVFAVPDHASPPEPPRLYTFNSQGWRHPEREGRWLRWMNQEDSILYLYSSHKETGRLRFAVDAAPQLYLPTLTLYLQSDKVDEFIVDDRTTYATQPVTITHGMNVFRFHASEECDDLEVNEADCRILALDHVSFVPQDGLPGDELPDVSFGEQMVLRGWTVKKPVVRPGEKLTVTLTWQSEVQLGNAHVVFLHLMSPDGELVAQRDLAPIGDVVPASMWPEGATFEFPVTLDLPPDLAPGDYLLRTGVYLWPDMERLPVLAHVPGAELNVAELDTVRVVVR